MIDGGLLWALWFMLGFLAILLWCYFKFDVMQPAVLIAGMMALSVFLAWLQVNRWGLYIGEKTFFCLSIAVLAFAAGSLWSHMRLRGLHTGKAGVMLYQVSGKGLIFSMLLLVVLLFFSAKEIYELSLALGNREGFGKMIYVVRMAVFHQTVELSRWMNYRQLVAQIIAYVYLFAFINNWFVKKWQIKDALLLLPCIMYIPFTILTTGRMATICFAIYGIMIYTVLIKRKYSDGTRANVRSLGALMVLAVGGMSLFFLMGIFTGKVISGNRTAFVILAHYVGLSIPALDVQLENITPESLLIGEHTLNGIYRILSRVGMDLPNVKIFLPFTYFHDIDTNVYTAEWRYVADFGYLGMAAIMGILGIFYTAFYQWVCKAHAGAFSIMFYCSICFPLFLSSIDERFFLDLIGTPILYLGTLLYLIQKLVLRRV